jgi:PPM family protein phosphatase
MGTVRYMDCAGASTSAFGQHANRNADRFEAPARGTCAVVADGMGSVSGGGHAAEIAVRLVSSLIDRLPGETGVDRLALAVRQASDRIAHDADLDDLYRGMGCTIAACVLSEGQLVVAHAGDSRVYLVRNAELVQVTSDHCLPLPPGKSARILTRALGVPGHDLAETRCVEVHPGDRLLLATDGLYRVFVDTHMLRVIQEHASPRAAADQLVAMAKQRRNDDDATCVVVDLG